MMSNLTKISNKVQAISPDVKVTLERNCVVLNGELSKWDDVVACGKAAVSKKYLGVINNIKLKGFTPKTHLPEVSDNLYEGASPDVLIVGGGVVGAAIARELSKWKLDTMLVEKGYDVALGASSRNDGCVHVGIDLSPNQLKLKYNGRGNAIYGDMCRDLGVKFERSGQTILMYYNWEKHIIPLFKLVARVLKVKDVRYMKLDELKKLEPNVVSWAKGAYYMPTGGIVSPYKLVVALAENAAQNGVKFCLNTAVLGMKVIDGEVKEVKTNRGTIYPKLVINAAGVFSDIIADMAGDRTFTIHPRKGINLIMDKKAGMLARTSMSKMPFIKISQNFKDEVKPKGLIKTLLTEQVNETKTTHTKGGGVVHTADNNVLVGPNAVEIPEREDYTTDLDSIKAIFAKQSIVQDKLKMNEIITYFAGVRAATYEEDFVVRKGIFTKNILEAAGIQSPGITAAPAIAEDISKWAVEYLGEKQKVLKNEKFNPIRKPVPHLAEMSESQRNELIRENPDYGEIVCRCEEISKGEIIDALNSPIPVYTVDAIKRRVRPGMGRCQGGFCGPQVIKILAQQKGVSVEQIMKAGDNSNILFEKTKGGQ
ncbi:MAG: NAD(P)/FAD-dependent oxidoreductase [Clostridia bacterium]